MTSTIKYLANGIPFIWYSNTKSILSVFKFSQRTQKKWGIVLRFVGYIICIHIFLYFSYIRKFTTDDYITYYDAAPGHARGWDDVSQNNSHNIDMISLYTDISIYEYIDIT